MNEAFQSMNLMINTIPTILVAGLGVVAVFTVARAWWRERGHRNWS